MSEKLLTNLPTEVATFLQEFIAAVTRRYLMILFR